MRDGEIRMRALWKKLLLDAPESKPLGRIPLNASKQQLELVLNQVGEEIKNKGKHPELLIKYFYLLGRIKFIDGNYDEARAMFGQCNMITMNEGFPEIHETYYWFGRINDEIEEGSGDFYYRQAVEKFNYNPNYITKQEIERAIT
jgi:hypothetical protein